jgi:DNA helicase II / ATP-dependent DNA helicase PcrA
MYVAITRARQRLYISMAQTRMLHGQTRYNLRSRFLEELPQETLRWLTPRVDNRWSGAGSSGVLAEAAPAGRWVRQGMGDRGSASPSFQKPAIAGHTHDSGFYVGQAVRHSRFGDGVILALEGSGSEGRAQVNFKRDGAKWLALGVAKLEAAE